MFEQSFFTKFITELAEKTSASPYITEAVTSGYKHIMENEEVPNTSLTVDSDFVSGYIEALIFCGVDVGNPSGEGSDAFDIDDFAPETIAEIVRECNDFVSANASTLNAAYQTANYDEAQAGRDFWFTRNGHGVGFWDRGLDQIGKELTKASKVYGESNAYAGDDGKVYLM